MTAVSMQGFVALAKSATGAAACADLIQRATSSNGVYSFTPLLQFAHIQKVLHPYREGDC